MGKPRLIILIRHAQSEGNSNRSIHQVVPDHRVKLTEEGWKQAEDAGHRLRHLLRPDDTLQVFTSPYRRTRETTEGILKTLTSTTTSSDDDTPSPSPFSRSKIKVYEEPRLREQDFGNFQPNSAEMERMWRERADYGHFFYRIPNGESAADAYDRIAGFNESLWRQFGEREFPSVLVLVTHGLMTRVFLMKWYHWSVEYFEDLRNVNHCEFVLMKQNRESGKYLLETQLRTWSELKRLRAAEKAQKEGEEARKNPNRRNTLSAFLARPEKSPIMKGQNQHGKDEKPGDGDCALPPAAPGGTAARNEADDHPLSSQEAHARSNTDGGADSDPRPPPTSVPSYLTHGGAGRTISGADTPHEMPSDDEGDHSYFPSPTTTDASDAVPHARSIATAIRKVPERKPTPEDIERWTNESGMGEGKQADALGDEPAPAPAVEDKDGELPDQDGVVGMVEKEEKEDRSLRGSVH